ncbi:MAG: PD-(D/E)XK nuclease family protein, partial [Clostridia bacterium]|nr:PD-(D/E)XK nuclease family protein [Clostridia bacterium]
AAYAVCRERYPSETEKLVAAAELKRGSLSPDAVRALYGEKLRLSASRIDLFASCRFGYFMRYGLKAKPREPAGFTPPELGTFMHFVLERTASAVMEAGGFKKVDDSELDALTDRFVGEYIRDNLNDFRERSKRFEYLFRRLIRDVRRIVRDTASELRCSDFVPLSFELDMGREKNLPPIRLGRGEDILTLTGIVDRVDGWVHDGRLYLRVVDYKTGRKSFSLSDVWYGMNLQMLLYLFSLCRNGERLYGKETVPAGVLYVPARDVMLSSPAEPSEDAAAKKRSSELKRSGLLLGDPDVLSAMEHGDTPRYLPISIRGGKPTGDSLASAEQLGLLARHLEDTLTGMASELRRGSIAADPFYRTQQETACTYCKYLEACRFSDGENGECHRRLPKLPASRVWNYMEGGEQDG